MKDDTEEEPEKITRTLTKRNTLTLNQKGEQTFVFLDLGETFGAKRYWLDFEDSSDILRMKEFYLNFQ